MPSGEPSVTKRRRQHALARTDLGAPLQLPQQTGGQLGDRRVVEVEVARGERIAEVEAGRIVVADGRPGAAARRAHALRRLRRRHRRMQDVGPVGHPALADR